MIFLTRLETSDFCIDQHGSNLIQNDGDFAVLVESTLFAKVLKNGFDIMNI